MLKLLSNKKSINYPSWVFEITLKRNSVRYWNRMFYSYQKIFNKTTKDVDR